MKILSAAQSSILRRTCINPAVPLTMLIVAATAIPIELRPARHSIVDLGANPVDVMQNILGFIPLGLAFAPFGFARATALAAVVSLCVEIAQIWSIARYPAPIDFLSNVTGAAIGALAGRRWPLPPIRVGRRIAMTAAATAIALIAILAIPGKPSTLENWDPSAQFVIGDEVTRDRRWQGEILQLEIVPGYGPVNNPGPVREPLLLPEERRQFFDAIVRNGAFTISARIRPHNVEQEGPTRIVTYSQSLLIRNFTLGQERRRLVFRVRTPVSGLSGRAPEVQTVPVLSPGREVEVIASYDGRISSVFVDGKLAGRENLAAAGKLVPALSDVHLPLMIVTVGMLTAIAAAGWLRPLKYIAGLWTASASGTAGSVALLIVGGASTVPAYYPWIPVLGLAGGLATGVSLEARPVKADKIMQRDKSSWK